MNRASRRRQEKLSKATSPAGRGAPAALRDPRLAEAVGQAMRLQQQGRAAEAERLYGEILARQPEHPEANHFLGLLMHQSGRTEEGLALIARSIGADPENADFHNNLGTVLKDRERFGDSIESFRRAIALRPSFAVAHNNLGVALKELGRYEEAYRSYREALRLQPAYVGARLNLANAEKEEGRLDAAAEDYRGALKLKPNDAETCYQLGMTLTEGGAKEPAMEAFRRAIALKPRHAESYLMLSTLKRQKEPDAEMAAMERLFGRADATESEKMVVAFALAKALEDLGRYDEALDYLVSGNALRRKTFDYQTAGARAHFEEVKTTFTPSLFERLGNAGDPDPTPVFIVGMPRSGTTLVEQILASHPAVVGPGELSALQAVASAAFPGDNGSAFPADLGALDPEAFREAGQTYVEALRAYSADAVRITDKMPGNFLLIGLIRLILPKATVIHCVRDAPATCLSIFKTFFRSQGHRYGYDLAELGDYYALYADLMEHWHRVLPGFVHDVRYEELVADQEAQSRRLVALAGLDWDDRCLAFHEAKRPVRTASAAQVRQPIYASSLDLWRRYEQGLKPLLDRLPAQD
ncbi:MAG: tetratricopeptide repeat-containing sulfotransferase family protein [Pararhizobium sp.]